MKATPFFVAWGFIFFVAAYDVFFAWHYRADFPSWEQNPLARWGVERFGLLSVFGFKFAGLAFAAAVAWHCRWHARSAGRILTATLTAAYLLLLTHYYVGHRDATEQRLAAAWKSHFSSTHR